MNVSIESWETKSLLLNHLRRNPPSVVLGSDTEAPRGYYSCTLQGENGPMIYIGVITCQSKAPASLYVATSQRAVFGYDHSVTTLEYQSAKVRQTIPLDGVFFEFLQDEERALVLVLHELGVVAISELGEELWRYTATSILEGWRKASGLLILNLMDTREPVELRLEDGAVVS